MTEFISLLLKLTVASSVGIFAVLLLRSRIRAQFGAIAAYRLWLVVPTLMVAVMLPPRAETVLLPAPVSTQDPAPLVTLPDLSNVVASPDLAEPHPIKATTAPTFEAAPVPEGLILETASVPAAAIEPSATPIAPLEIALTPKVWSTGDLPVTLFALWMWLTGVAASLTVQYRRQQQFEADLGHLTPTRLADGTLVWRASSDQTGPALVGLRSPRIVVPSDFDERYDQLERTLIIAHEDVHRRRGDAAINGLAAALTALFWFNPLIHRAASRLRLDQELACDAAVLRSHPGKERPYAEALLKDQLRASRLPLACHWTGSHPLKERITMMTKSIPSTGVRWLGNASVLAITLGAGAIAWASQPPKIIDAIEDATPDTEEAAPAEPAAPQPTTFAPLFEGPETKQAADVRGLKIVRAEAVVTVLPEARDDYEVSIQGKAPKRIYEKDGKLIVEGNMPKNNYRCRFKTAEALLRSDDALQITVRAPLDADLAIDGNTFSTVGALADGDVSFHGCGQATVADTAGDLDVSVHGSADVKIGNIDGLLDMSVHGSADLIVGDVNGDVDMSVHGSADLSLGDIAGDLDASVHGSADATMGTVAGGLDASVHGSGDMTINAVAEASDLSVHGSGDLSIGTQMTALEISVHGSGDIEIGKINADDVEIALRGSAGVEIGDGKITDLIIEVSGSADAEFAGHAVNARVDNRTRSDVYIGSVDRLVLAQDKNDKYGRVRTKSGQINSTNF